MEEKVYVHPAILEVQRLHKEIFEDTSEDTTVREQLESLAENLLLAHQAGRSAAHVEIANWHPRFAGKSEEEIMSSLFEMADAKLVVAREHGFDDWNEVEKNGDRKFNLKFEKVIESMLAGDVEELQAQIRDNKDILKERSPYGHRATLLHYVSCNGVEIRRQQVPRNLVDITKFLIAQGADPNARAKLYGGQFTPLELTTTSAHPNAAGVRDELLFVLKNYR